MSIEHNISPATGLASLDTNNFTKYFTKGFLYGFAKGFAQGPATEIILARTAAQTRNTFCASTYGTCLFYECPVMADLSSFSEIVVVVRPLHPPLPAMKRKYKHVSWNWQAVSVRSIREWFSNHQR